MILALLLCACAKHSSEETQQKETLANQQAIRDFYCQNITDDTIFNRCDRSTFTYLANAFCPNKPYDSNRFIWQPGEYHRDYSPNTCYQNGSESECSPDSFIMKVHEWISRRDLESAKEINDLISYLDKSAWKCGEGPLSLTNILHLKPIIYAVKGFITRQKQTPLALAEDDALPIGTHNKYLTALYIYAEARMNGSIGETEKQIINQFVESDPESPVFLSIYYRFHDGDQQKALDIMQRDFPADRVCDIRHYGSWGSAPGAIIQILSTAILEGR